MLFAEMVELMNFLGDLLCNSLKLKNLGRQKQFLGVILICNGCSSVGMRQKKLIKKRLQITRMPSFKPVGIPINKTMLQSGVPQKPRAG